MKKYSHNTTLTAFEVRERYSNKDENISFAVYIGKPHSTYRYTSKELEKRGIHGVYQTQPLPPNLIRLMHTI